LVERQVEGEREPGEPISTGNALLALPARDLVPGDGGDASGGAEPGREPELGDAVFFAHPCDQGANRLGLGWPGVKAAPLARASPPRHRRPPTIDWPRARPLFWLLSTAPVRQFHEEEPPQ